MIPRYSHNRLYHHARIQRGGGGRGPDPPPENHKSIGFYSYAGPDPLENHKATKLQCRPSICMAFRWQADDAPLLVAFGSSCLSPHQQKKKEKKRCRSCRVGPPLTKLSGSAHYLVETSANCVFHSSLIALVFFLLQPLRTKAHKVKYFINKNNEPVHEITNNVVCATCKASDQPAHTCSLIRAFASRLSIL